LSWADSLARLIPALTATPETLPETLFCDRATSNGRLFMLKTGQLFRLYDTPFSPTSPHFRIFIFFPRAKKMKFFSHPSCSHFVLLTHLLLADKQNKKRATAPLCKYKTA